MKIKVLLLLLALTLITGCVDARYHLTVNRDGSGDIELKVAFSDLALRLIGEAGNDPLDTLASDLKLDGYTVSSFREQGKAGIIAQKHVDTISDQSLDLTWAPSLQSAVATGDPPASFQVERSLLRVCYKIETEIDPARFTGTSQLGNLENYLLNQINFEFLLTLPIKPDAHNALSTQDQGRTMLWKLQPGQNNRIALEASHPNPLGFILTGLVILLLGAVVVVKVKNRKYRG